MAVEDQQGVPAIGLAALLRDYRDKSGDSYADMAAKTGLNRSYFGYLINTAPPVWVRGETIASIANGLRLPLELVQHAALVTGGYYTPEEARRTAPKRSAAVSALLDELDDEDLENIEAMVRTMVARRQRVAEQR